MGLTRAQAEALRSYISRKSGLPGTVAGALVNTVFVVARERGLDPQLVLAVIAIESRYNPYAESHVGAQGLMQVMPKVHKDKFEAFTDGQIAALNPIANIRVGSAIPVRLNRDAVRGRWLGVLCGRDRPLGRRLRRESIGRRRRIALASGITRGGR